MSLTKLFLDFSVVMNMISPQTQSEQTTKIQNTIEDSSIESTEWVGKEFFATYLSFAVDFPYEYGLLVHDSASSRGIDPWDLAAVLISEKSGPDYDFSIEGSIKQYGTFKWDNSNVGQEGEVGFFQIKERWARKAGYKGDELYKEEVNIDVAGYVVSENMNSHEKCKSQKGTYHDWIAHYKCAKSDRNKFEGFCRFKQENWERIRESLGKVMSPDFKEINKNMKNRIEKKRKKNADESIRKPK